ncbi:hypothetical protein GS424_008560 [Eggerthella guodeyinii]|uniref:Uncharacterized protein n=1 Tax=Eggerthella guodeyinii TaxID=2690837 RepID=A0A6L7ITG2_9ACTN|nr:hypothetical protein [Eggerthella guodeyinii]QOS69871.1 hypothetical protein GS424_008560 [Eggerthella guodeyinii]
MKERITTIVPRALTALFLAVALSLPNYSAAFEAWHDQDDYLSSLYDQYLSEFGAQEAHAILPALALPAALTAAGVTTETAAAAFAAICTAVAGVSLVQAWDDLSLKDKQTYGSQTGYLQALLFGGAISQGLWTWDQNGGEPPEPNGDGGNKLNAAIIALCTGAGVVAVKDLADAAGYLIDFLTNPAGEDENGLLTGLGIGSGKKIKGLDVDIPSISLLSNNVLSNGYKFGSQYNMFQVGYTSDNRLLLSNVFSGQVFFILFQNTDGRLFLVPRPFSWSKGTDGNYSLKYQTVDPSGSYEYRYFNPADVDTSLCAVYPVFPSVISLIDNTDSGKGGEIYSNGVWDDSLIDSSNSGFLSSNAPIASSDMLGGVAQAGVGSEAAQQIVNSYVTNNIANSEKVVTVPSSLEDTADYDKVVRDPEPDPDPGGDPDPDPGGDETTAQKAEKLAKLPVQQLFPFCLIYDIQLLVEHVAGGGVATMADDSLVFEFDVGFGYFDAPLVIDLTDYRDMQGTFHMAFDVMLVVGLLYFSISLFLKARSD